MTDADADAAAARLEGEVAQLLQQIPTAPGGNAAQLELLTRAQEIALHRDPTRERARLLHAARPFLPTLLHQQNAPLVAAVLALLAEAARRSAVFHGDLFDGVSTVLLLSFSSEKNVLRALDLATDALLGAFQSVVASQAPHDELAQLWAHVTTALDHAADLVATGPLALPDSEPNNNRSAAVFLRAWKLLERAVLLLTEAKDATVYRDPARSNVQPDAVSVDLVPAAGHAVLDRGQLLARGDALLRRMIDRVLLAPTALHGAAPLTRRELCVAINSLSLVAAVRPQLMGIVLPALLACHAPDPAAGDRAVQSTLKANLVKLLSHPAAQELADEVTECVIALQDGERAFRAISKSKDPRRKYVSAPSEASLRRARIGKRTAEQISESVEQQDHAKRARAAQQQQQQQPSSSASERITPESLVNMPSAAVLHLVLGAFAAELPPPPPANLALLLPPSELKTRMAALLAKLATPSSVLALETSLRRSRDPRRRRESRGGDAHQQPSLLAVFDDETVDEVSDWVSKNSTTAEEPLVSLAEDNSVQVFLKPVSAAWCRDMASAALARILENEYGVGIRGDDALREKLLCRLASSPWFLLTDERNATIHPSRDDARLPPMYQTIFDFVLEDVERRASLGSALLHHEYVRVTAELVQTPEDGDAMEDHAGPPRTGDVVYRTALTYFLRALVGALDLSSSSGKKLFGGVVAALPCVTVEVFRVVATLFEDPHKSAGGAVLGITVLRDLVRERKSCEQTALRVLLQYTCDRDETCRNSSIRCVANQLYVLEALKKPIEEYAIALVASLEEGATAAATTTTTSETKDEGENDDEDVTMTETAPASEAQNGDEVASIDTTSSSTPGDVSIADVADTPATRSAWLRARLAQIEAQDRGHAAELQHFAHALDGASAPLALDAEMDVLRRLELFLALCAKKPALLGHVVATYGRAANELVRQVVFHAIEKLIKHLKTRSSGAAAVVAQLYGFTAPSLPLVCHVVQLLAARSSSSTTDATADALVPQVLALWRAHMHVADAVSVVIPVMSRVPRDSLMPLLPPLLSLPAGKWGVAMTRVFEALPPHQVLTPIDLLLALHHVDLAQDAGLQKKVIAGINFCLEHRHAFPAEVLLHVCRVLLQEPAIPKLALRTLILSVTAFPSLQHDAAQLLRGLVERRVWELAAAAEPERGDALWKGFVKCAALVQPASFPVLLDDTWFPVKQLASVLQDEPALRGLMRAYVESPEAAEQVRVSDAVRALLMEGADDETVKEEDGAAEGLKEDEAAHEHEEQQRYEEVDEIETVVKSEA